MRRIFLRESSAFVCHREASVCSDGHLDIVAVVDFVEIGEESLGRVVFRADRSRPMQLPEIFQARSFMNNLPVLGRTAFSLAIVHQGDPRTDGMHHLRRSRMGIAVASGVKYRERADQIVRTSQGVLLIPRQVSKIEKPEGTVSDDKSNRFKVFRRGILVF